MKLTKNELLFLKEIIPNILSDFEKSDIWLSSFESVKEARDFIRKVERARE